MKVKGRENVVDLIRRRLVCLTIGLEIVLVSVTSGNAIFRDQNPIPPRFTTIIVLLLLAKTNTISKDSNFRR